MATTITAGNATNGLALTPDNTGILQLKTGTGSGTAALTLDASQNATIAGNLTLTGNASGVIKSGTAVASTSGTSIDFTGIPSTAKRITVMFNGVSTNGTSNMQIQLGSGSPTTSGYLGQVWQANTGNATFSSGFALATSTSATFTNYGAIVFNNVSGNTWVGFGNLGRVTSGDVISLGGAIALSGALDRVRITTANGTDTFDAGSINILWE